MQEEITIPSRISFLALGIALENVVVFLAQMVIYASYAIFPSKETGTAAVITTISTIVVVIFIILGVWKKKYFFSLGLILSLLMRLIADFPIIFGNGS